MEIDLDLILHAIVPHLPPISCHFNAISEILFAPWSLFGDQLIVHHMSIISNLPMAMGTDEQQVIHPFFRQGQNVTHSRR